MSESADQDRCVTRRSGALVAAVGVVILSACSAGADATKPICPKVAFWPVSVYEPMFGGIVGSGQQFFATQVAANATYSVSITGVNDPTASLSVYENACSFLPKTTTVAGTSPQEVVTFVAGDSIWFGVNEHAGAGNIVTFTVLVVPMPPVTSAHSESIAVARDVPTLAQVGAGSTSHYWTPGVIPGIPYAVSIVALNDDAVLHAYLDSTYTQELDCPLLATHIVNAPQECIVFSTGALYFTVTGGAAAVNGAHYEILISRI